MSIDRRLNRLEGREFFRASIRVLVAPGVDPRVAVDKELERLGLTVHSCDIEVVYLHSRRGNELFDPSWPWVTFGRPSP